jgi:hypothetical protein
MDCRVAALLAVTDFWGSDTLRCDGFLVTVAHFGVTDFLVAVAHFAVPFKLSLRAKRGNP